jgi:hypothetical protein
MGTSDWVAWQYLIGEWIGAGGGAPGQGEGIMTFQFDLQEQVLLRRNHVEFPSTPERPAFAHDDLTVIYPDQQGRLRASYFDNEGHAISYSVTSNETALILVSDPEPSAPRFRTTYLKGALGSVITRFEIAPPGNPDAFTIYVEGSAKRK